MHCLWCSPCHVAAITTIQDPTVAPEYSLHSNAFNPNTGKLAEYNELSHSSDGAMWQVSKAMEIHQLAQGHDNITGTNTVFCLPVSAIPHDKKATYLCIVCAHHPEKEVPHHVQWTMGGDCVKYEGNVSTETADIVMAKLLFNSIVSTPNGCCMIGDLKDFYLGTPHAATGLCIHADPGCHVAPGHHGALSTP